MELVEELIELVEEEEAVLKELAKYEVLAEKETGLI